MPELLIDLITMAMRTIASRTYDGRIHLLEYVPTVLSGPPAPANA
jgi:hypothetical protein